MIRPELSQRAARFLITVIVDHDHELLHELRVNRVNRSTEFAEYCAVGVGARIATVVINCQETT